MATPRVAFLLATVSDRFEMAQTFLRTVREYRPDWPVFVVAQEYTAAQRHIGTGGVRARYIDQRLGMHAAKSLGLLWMMEHFRGQPYATCSVDDDMELIPQTKYDPIVEWCQRPGVGLVSAGWAPHETRASAWPLVDTFVKQPIVYTGGGLFFNHHVAALLLNRLPPTAAFWSDNTEWSLATYLAGYENYRYRGSLTIHRVCRTGGRKAWIKAGTRQLPDPRYLTMRPEKNRPGEYCIGASSDLTPLAHATHAANKP